VADVASDSNTGRVLHEGTGLFKPLIVVYTPPGGEPIAGIGYVFSHYEFAEPDWNRLNDAEWADRLQESPPPHPVWTSGFLPPDWPEVIYLPLVARNCVPPADHLVISELLYDPAGVADADGEWIEIYNPTAIHHRHPDRLQSQRW